MNDDPKTSKFLIFYLSELLVHVKSMGEHRFSPAEFSALKKILSYLHHGADPLTRLNSLAAISVLQPLYNFLQGLLAKQSDPQFRKSQVMASIEIDSEKVIQIFIKIYESPETKERLVEEAKTLGIQLQFKDTQAKLPVKDKPSEKTKTETSEPANTAAEEPAKESSEKSFSRVGDVIGFFSNRSRKISSKKAEPSEDIPDKKTEADKITEKTSGDSIRIFQQELQGEDPDMIKALEQIKRNPTRSAYIVELADIFGNMKKHARMSEEMAVYDRFRHAEKILNDIADNLSGPGKGFSEAMLAAVETLVRGIRQWAHEANARDTEELMKMLDRDIGLLETTAGYEPSKTAETTRVSAAVSQPAGSATAVRLYLDHLDEETRQIFFEESVSTLSGLQKAVESLHTNTGDRAAWKEIQRANHTLITTARILKIPTLIQIGTMIENILFKVLDQDAPVTAAMTGLLEESSVILRRLFNKETIDRAAWDDYINRYSTKEAITVKPEIATGEQSQEPETIIQKGDESLDVSISTRSEVSVLRRDDNLWIDQIQALLSQYLDGKIVPIPTAVQTVAETVETRKKETPLSRKPDEILPQKETFEEFQTEKQTTSRGIEPSKIPAEKKTVEFSEDNLLEIMTDPETSKDLAKLKVMTFMERLNIEPEDIPEVRKIKRRKITKKPVVTPQNAVTEAVSKVQTKDLLQEVEQLPSKIQRIRLQERKFTDVDAEILDIFNQESESYFRLLDKALKRLQTNLKDDAALKDIERVSHSIKSSARMLGFERISGMAACLELITERYFENEIEFDEKLLRLFEDIIKTLKSLYKSEPADITAIALTLRAMEKQFSIPGLFTKYLMGDNPDLPDTDAVKSGDETKASGETDPRTQEIVPEELVRKTGKQYFEIVGIEDEMVDIFKEEAVTYFKLYNTAMNQLYQDSRHIASVRDIEKSAHSLRSSARMLGLQKIADLAKPIETLAERIAQGALIMDAPTLQLFNAGLKNLETLAAGADVLVDDLVDRLNQTLTAIPATPSNGVHSGAESITDITRVELVQAANEPDKKIYRKKKKVSKKTIPFTDVNLQQDPILKNLFRGEQSLLNDMISGQ